MNYDLLPEKFKVTTPPPSTKEFTWLCDFLFRGLGVETASGPAEPSLFVYVYRGAGRWWVTTTATVRERAEREKWPIVRVFHDEISTTMLQ